jgi:hypothetical protein
MEGRDLPDLKRARPLDELAVRSKAGDGVSNGSNCDLPRMPSGCRTPKAHPVALAQPLARLGKPGYRRTGLPIEPVTASAGVGCQAASFCSAASISAGSMRALICSRRRADTGSPERAANANHL